MNDSNFSRDNSISDQENFVDYNKRYHLNIIGPILWSLLLIIVVFGNGLIIYIIIKRRLYRNSCTNCYIINVAIADLTFAMICIPFTMSAYVYDEWIFGRFLCKFGNMLMYSSVQAACLTLTAMTIDRYLAILYPLKSLDYRTTKLALLINIFIWIASFLLNIPFFLFHEYKIDEENITYCYLNFNKNDKLEIIMTLYTIMISYVLPLSVIIFCYSRMIIKIVGNSKSKSFLEENKKSYRSNIRLNAQTSLNDDEKKICYNSKIKESPIIIKSLNEKTQYTKYESEFDDLSMCSNSNQKIGSVKKINELQFYNEQNEKFIAKVSFKTNSDTILYSNAEKNKKKNKNNKKFNEKVSNMTISGKSTVNAKKQKIKLLFLIAIVAITFAFTWLPTHIIIIWKKLFPLLFPYNDAMYILKFIAHTLSYTNSLINPFIYVFIGAKFRNHIYLEFNNIFQICCGKSLIKQKSFNRSTLTASTSIQGKNPYNFSSSKVTIKSNSNVNNTYLNLKQNITENTLKQVNASSAISTSF